MSTRVPRASRRAVVAGGAGLVATLATGCGPTVPGDAPGGVADPTEPAVDADSGLVEEVTSALAGALGTASATGRAHPPLRPLSRDLVALHRRHGDELGGLPPAEPAGRPPRQEAAARAALLAAEERLERRLVQAALAAESGALAQTFASMAAAVAQRRVVAS